MYVLARDLRRELLDGRGVVENPDRAPVRAEDKIVVARVDENVVNGDVRQVLQTEARPVVAARVRDIETEFRPGVNQFRILRVFAHHPDVRLRGEIAGDVAEGASAVRRLEDVGAKVVEHVAVETRRRPCPRPRATARRARRASSARRPRRSS